MSTAAERLAEYKRKQNPFGSVVSVKGDPGKDGYTPKKGVDYMTPAEIQEFHDIIDRKLKTFEKGLKGDPGLQGKPGINGIGIPGLKGDPGKDGEDGITPIHGVHYFTKKDQEILINRILPRIKVPKVEEVVAEVKKTPVKYEEIHNAPDLKDLPALINFLRAGGFRGGGSSTTSTTSVFNEVVAGSATTFTLAHTPTASSVRIYALGQRLVLTTDYSIVGAVITTVSSWLAGQIIADYIY